MPIDPMTTRTREVPLAHGTRLVVTPTGPGDAVQIHGADGRALVTIQVTAAGATVSVAAPTLRIEASERLELAAPTVAIAASESLELTSDDAAALRAGGMLETDAHAQHIRSERGDIRIDANDDVRIDGERVMVNCDRLK